ncbi:unnamed protein product, partial [Acanthocheilonema viteae]
GCPSFRKRRPSLAPLLEATGATSVIATQSGISNHINRAKDHKNNNGRINSSNMKFRSPIVAPSTLSSSLIKTTAAIGIMQEDEYESDDSLVV